MDEVMVVRVRVMVRVMTVKVMTVMVMRVAGEVVHLSLRLLFLPSPLLLPPPLQCSEAPALAPCTLQPHGPVAASSTAASLASHTAERRRTVATSRRPPVAHPHLAR